MAEACKVYELGADEKKDGVDLGWDAGHKHTLSTEGAYPAASSPASEVQCSAVGNYNVHN